MLSVSLDLRGTLVLVVGGGKVATKRIERMLAAGAELTLVEPVLSEEVGLVLSRAIEARSNPGDNVRHLAMTWEEFRSTNPEPNFKLVCACTGSVDVNEEVADFGRACGAFVNRVDRGRASSLHFVAESRVGDVRMAIATGGVAPVVSRAMREVFENRHLPQWAERAVEVAELREQAKTLPKGRRSRFWATLRQRLTETAGDDPGFAGFARSLLEKLSS